MFRSLSVCILVSSASFLYHFQTVITGEVCLNNVIGFGKSLDIMEVLYWLRFAAPGHIIRYAD
jgi:hypothetical protein